MKTGTATACQLVRSGNTKVIHDTVSPSLQQLGSSYELIQSFLDRMQIASESEIPRLRESRSMGSEPQPTEAAKQNQSVPSRLVFKDMNAMNYLREKIHLYLVGRCCDSCPEGLVSFVNRLEDWTRKSIPYVSEGPFRQHHVRIDEEKQTLAFPSMSRLLAIPRSTLKRGNLVARLFCLCSQAIDGDADTKCNSTVHVIGYRPPISRQRAERKIHFDASELVCCGMFAVDRRLSNSQVVGDAA